MGSFEESAISVLSCTSVLASAVNAKEAVTVGLVALRAHGAGLATGVELDGLLFAALLAISAISASVLAGAVNAKEAVAVGLVAL